jgi:hypothetical protein
MANATQPYVEYRADPGDRPELVCWFTRSGRRFKPGDEPDPNDLPCGGRIKTSGAPGVVICDHCNRPQGPDHPIQKGIDEHHARLKAQGPPAPVVVESADYVATIFTRVQRLEQWKAAVEKRLQALEARKR